MSREALITAEFLPLAADVPAMQHPWFQGIIQVEFSRPQIAIGEEQHYLRGRLNGEIFGAILEAATREGDPEVLAAAQDNYDEEMSGEKSHSDLMYQMHDMYGVSREEAAAFPPMPGTMAAISMLTQSIKTMTALEGMAMMALPELQNAPVSAAVYDALINDYGFPEYAVETFKVHSTVDIGHGETQLDLLAGKVEESPAIKPGILRAMRFGVVAFNFEWDGHYQAATRQQHFHWAGLQTEAS